MSLSMKQKQTHRHKRTDLQLKKPMRQDNIVLCSVQSLSCVQLLAIPWTVAHQAPLSLRFPRQEYWSGLPFPSPGDLPNPGLLCLLHWQADSLSLCHLGSLKQFYYPFFFFLSAKKRTCSHIFKWMFSSVLLLSCVQLFATP